MKHISALTWFRFESNDLNLGEWAGFRWHLLRCETCRAQLTQRAVLGGDESAPSRVPISRLGIAFTAVLCLVGTAFFFARARLEPDPDLTMKGESAFSLVVITPQATGFGSRCAPGDVVQAEVRTSKEFIVVVGVSATGAQVLYPVTGSRSAEVKDGRARMPNSWVLDDAPGVERFVAVLSDEPLEVAHVVQSVLRGQPIAGTELLIRSCEKDARDAFR